jgi:hypothetical protein
MIEGVYDELPSSLKRYEWTCPRLGCKKYIMTYTENSFEILRDMHLDKHAREDREEMVKFQETLKRIPRDHDKLILTWEDINFLTTRGIRIDEQIEYDPTLKRHVCFEEKQPKNWSKILERL